MNESTNTRLLRLPEVQRITGMGRSTIWKRAGDGTFPKPVKLGPRTTAWVAGEVEQWANSAIAQRQ
ncbi:helix-turn-helix transcriptional regulator [Xanthomonas citri]|uniref:helix-turn-helix transcriptional regulator n=1 Tax=Xanthomonas citri TaxID=346 RepID=UPI00053812B9|nr:AlpA family transcriptional regulator [Xanthomonas citri]